MDAVNEHREQCRHCGHDGLQRVTLRTTGVHYADVHCGACGRHLRFLSKPGSDPTKYRRPQQHRDLVLAYSDGFCEMWIICTACHRMIHWIRTYHGHDNPAELPRGLFAK